MDKVNQSLCERLSNSGSMLDAEMELLATGVEALPVLEAILSGEARNQFGVAYRELGHTTSSALHVALYMGMSAKPLEGYIRQEVQRGVQSVAARAMRELAPLEEESVAALAKNIGRSGNLDVAYEATITLILLGYVEHPAVVAQLAESPAAMGMWQRALTYSANLQSNSGNAQR